MALWFARGDRRALEHFYHLLYPGICLYAFHFVQDRSKAEEIASDSFIKSWKQNSKLADPLSIRAYLYAVARHESLRMLKKDKRRTLDPQRLPSVSPEEDGYNKLVSAELTRLLHAALKEISPGSGRILKLHYLEGKTLTEIAAELHISTSTVKTQKQRGLKALHKKLLRPLLFFF
jgi:RNA polymerase sigma-70 factor, ECF subfamily